MPLMLGGDLGGAFSLTSKIATLAPAAASARAVAAPRPDAPPVTIAACPLISMSSIPSGALSMAMTRDDSGVA